MDYHRYGVPSSMLAPPPSLPPPIGSLSSSGVTGGSAPALVLAPHPSLMFHYGGTVSSSSKAPPPHHLHSSSTLVSSSGSVYSKLPNTTHSLSSSSASSRSSVYPHSMGENIPPPPNSSSISSPNSSSFAAALRTLAKHAIPGTENESHITSSKSSTHLPPSTTHPTDPHKKTDPPPEGGMMGSEDLLMRGFQPYRSSEIAPTRGLGLDISHPPPQYPPYHPSMYQHPLSHSYSRLEEQLYLERMGLLRPSPYASAVSALYHSHPYLPPHFGSDLMSPISALHPSSALLHERLKLEEDMRQREYELELRREREMERERSKHKHSDEDGGKRRDRSPKPVSDGAQVGSSSMPVNGVREASVNHSLGVSSSSHYFGIPLLTNSSGGQAKTTSTPFQPPASSKATTTTTSSINSDTRQLSSLLSHPTASLTPQQYPKLELSGPLTKPSANFILPNITNSYLPPISIAPVPLNQSSANQGTRSTTSVTYSTVLQSNSVNQPSVVPSTKSRDSNSKQHAIIRPFEIGDVRMVTDDKLGIIESSTSLASATQAATLPHQNIVINSPLCMPFPSAVTNMPSSSCVPNSSSNSSFSLNSSLAQPGVSTVIAEKNAFAGTTIRPTDLLTSRPIPSVVAIPVKTEAIVSTKSVISGALWSPLAIEPKTIPKIHSTVSQSQAANSWPSSDSKSVNSIKKVESGVFSVVNLLPNSISSTPFKPVLGQPAMSQPSTTGSEAYAMLTTSIVSTSNLSTSSSANSINTSSQNTPSLIPGVSSAIILPPSNQFIPISNNSISNMAIKHEVESLKESLTVTGTNMMKSDSHETSSAVSNSQPKLSHLQMSLNPFQLSVTQSQSSQSQMQLTHTQGSMIVTHPQSSISHPQIASTHLQASHNLSQASISYSHPSILNSPILISNSQTSHVNPLITPIHPQNSLPHLQTSLPHLQTSLPHLQTSLPHIQTSLSQPQTSFPYSASNPDFTDSVPNNFDTFVKVPMVIRGQFLSHAEPVVPPPPSRSPVSLLDNRAKEEALQKEIEKEESERIEEQKRKLQEALKALEEAHIQEMTSIPVKQEVNRKEKIDTPLRSRKEELRIKREEEKAAREEAKTRKEEARQKKEEGLRVIRSELKRKMIEERIGAQKRVVRILHKGPAAPLHVTKKKMCIFSSVGLITHPEANEVLLKTCERRVALLSPLLSPSPSPPPVSMDCTETIGSFLVPEEPATCLSPPEELREGREEFMSSMGLREQTNSAKQYIEKEWECILEERLKRYNRNSKDGFRKSIAFTLSARINRRQKRKSLLSSTVEGLKIFCEQGTDNLSSILTLPMNMSPEMIEKLSSRLPNALVVNNNGLLQPLNQLNQPINIFNNTISSVYQPINQVNQTINTSGYHINESNQSSVINHQPISVNLPKTLNQPINTLIQPLNNLCQPIIQISQPINQTINQSIIIPSSVAQSKDNIVAQIQSSGNVQQNFQSGVSGNGSVQHLPKYSPEDPLPQNINGQSILQCNNGQPQIQNTNMQFQNTPGQPILQNVNGQPQLHNANGQPLLSVSDNFNALASMQNSKLQTGVTSYNNGNALTNSTSSQNLRPKTENISSDIANKAGSTSTALAHKRALVSQFEHDNLLSNLPALDNVVEHFVKAAQEGGGSSTALSEHIAGVRRCQSALINTAQLVQEHVTQLMIARQQFDAQKFALHQHLSSITSLLTPEDNKQSRLYKSPDVSNVLHPGCPISNTSTCDSEQKPLAVSLSGSGAFSAHSLANIKTESSAPISSTFSEGVPINSTIKTEVPFNNAFYNNGATYGPVSSNNVYAINNSSSLPNTNNKDPAIAPLSSIGEPKFASNHSTGEIILQPYNIKVADCKTPLKTKAISSVILSPTLVSQPISHYPMHVSTTQVTSSSYSSIASIANPPTSATMNIIPPIGGVSSSNVPLYSGPTNLIKPFTSTSNNVLSTRASLPSVGASITSTYSTVSVIHNLASTANKSNILPVNAVSATPATEKLVNSENVYFLQQVSAKKSNEVDSGCSFLKSIKPINQSHVKKSSKHVSTKINNSREFVPNHMSFGSKKHSLGVVTSKISSMPLYKHHQAPPSVGRVFNPSPTSAGVSATSKFGLPSQAVVSKVAHSSLLKSPKSGNKVAIGFTPYSSIKQTKNYGAI